MTSDIMGSTNGVLLFSKWSNSTYSRDKAIAGKRVDISNCNYVKEWRIDQQFKNKECFIEEYKDYQKEEKEIMAFVRDHYINYLADLLVSFNKTDEQPIKEACICNVCWYQMSIASAPNKDFELYKNVAGADQLSEDELKVFLKWDEGHDVIGDLDDLDSTKVLSAKELAYYDTVQTDEHLLKLTFEKHLLAIFKELKLITN
mmetsp:Transcript_4596/g.3867  ORF Transcript_4596/g.3867 Transcript_4596/m.3867 type:complete len:202 (+) Transcript_4596:93-698(+)